jgi:hypothetical protein
MPSSSLSRSEFKSRASEGKFIETNHWRNNSTITSNDQIKLETKRVIPLEIEDRKMFTRKNELSFASRLSSLNTIKTVSGKGSLLHFIDHMQKKVINVTILVTDDELENELLKKFKQKFIAREKIWNEIMDTIKNIAKEIDNKYFSKKYFGFYNSLCCDLENICLSIICLGESCRYGPGIDNLVEPRIHYFDNTTKRTVKEMIYEYIESLPSVFAAMDASYVSVPELDEEHESLNNQLECLNALTARDAKRINKLKIDAGIEKDILKKQEKDSIIAEEVAAYKKKIQDLEKCKQEIEVIIQQKSESNRALGARLHALRNVLQFSFFMHDDYTFLLDRDIFMH